MAGGEDLLRAFVHLGNHLLFKSKLPPVLREIAILRVGALSMRAGCSSTSGSRAASACPMRCSRRSARPDAAELDDVQR
jgi:hypothetical protein